VTAAFSDLLDVMTDYRKEQLARVLSWGAQALAERADPDPNAGNIPILHEIYDTDDPRDPALMYHQFWRENSISYLGGGNSKNFKIEPSDGSPAYVIKLDLSPLNAQIQVHLDQQSDVQEHLSPIFKKETVKVKNKPATIQALPLYTGDMETFVGKPKTQEERLLQTVKLYQQMAMIYENIRKADMILPDGKNSNWLLDENQKLCIADVKTFKLAEFNVCNEDLSHFGPYFMSIPENGPPYQVSKIHSLHLGKNIYQALTGCNWQYLLNPLVPGDKAYDKDAIKGCDAANYNFSAPIFQTPAGIRLKNLLQRMIKPDPKDRISVAKALQELREIDQLLLAPKENTIAEVEEPLQNNAEEASGSKLIQEALNPMHTSQPIVPTELPPVRKAAKPSEPETISTQQFHAFKEKASGVMKHGYRGDPKKKVILDNFAASVGKINSHGELTVAVKAFQSSQAYRTLCQDHQSSVGPNPAIIAFKDIITKVREKIDAQPSHRYRGQE
jgi:serine/threonine protein kinase